MSAEFLSRAGFPSHALVIRPNAPGADGSIFKGVADDATLADAIARCAQGSADGLTAIETDMRADRNPTRVSHRPALPGLWDARLRRRRRRARPAVRGVRSADRLGRRARRRLRALRTPATAPAR